MDARTLPHLRVDSNQYATNERFGRWCEGIADTFTVMLPEGLREEDFSYEIGFRQFGHLLLSDGRFGPRAHRRTARNIRADQLDHYRLLLQREGELQVDAAGRRECVRPGEMILVDLAREEGFSMAAGGANIVLYVPRELLDEAMPRPCDLHGARPGGGAARILAEHLRALVDASDRLTPQQAAPLAQATVGLLAASLAPSAQTLDHARPVLESTLLRQICRYVDLHLSEPDFAADQLCGFFHLSRSTLYRLFEPLGGVSHYLKERRLARVHALLAGSQRRIHLGRAAEAHGFKSATHFSRAFRQQFGYSPSAVRQGSALPSPPGGGIALREDDGYNAWLRALHD